MVISELIGTVKSELTDNAEFEAREIVMHALRLDRGSLIIKAREKADENGIKAALQMAERRKQGEPLQYILGFAEFMSLDFKVTSDTLIPRSDTETLVETVLKRIEGRRASLLDIGAGTGCIGISIAHYHGDIELTLADISRGALKTAAENAAANNVCAELLHMDILKECPDKKFDVIVSNPPYIESSVIPALQTEVKDYEPITALDGGEDGLMFYRRITELAPSLLNENGGLFFEIGYSQGKAVSELMSKGFKNIEIIKDLCGNDRVAAGIKRDTVLL